MRQPVLFVAHGAPDALLSAPKTVDVWRGLGDATRQANAPKGILVISAHWEARTPTASLAGAPATIHDFSGFDRSLYQLSYPAPGAPALAERVAARLLDAGIAADLHPTRGLDHGAWVPLLPMFPKADVPVTQLSLVHGGTAEFHLALGKALAPLRDEGILIVTSGAITHNFGWLARPSQRVQQQAHEFSEWVAQRVTANDGIGLCDFRLAPSGDEANPTDEHFLPLLVAVGAAAGDAPARHASPFTYGALSMDAYSWGLAA